MTESIIIVAIVIAIVGLAAGYVWRAKRNGRKCIEASIRNPSNVWVPRQASRNIPVAACPPALFGQ